MANENPEGQSNEGGEAGKGVASVAYTPDTFKEAGIPETFVKDGNYDLKGMASALTEAAALKSQAEERAKLVPQDGKYDFGLPKDFQYPEGLSAEQWQPEEKLTTAIAAAAKEAGLTQDQMAKLTLAYANVNIGRRNEVAAEHKAEMAKLGAGAETRLNNLMLALKPVLSKDHLMAVADGLTSAAAVEAIEKLVALVGDAKLSAGRGSDTKDRPDPNAMTGAQMHRLAIEESKRK